MTKFFNAFLTDEAGASAAEYALILAIVGVAIGAAALALGANVRAAIAGASDDVYSCNNTTKDLTAEVPDADAEAALAC